MFEVLADLHVHIGWAGGGPVKITASAALTVEAALAEAAGRRGLGVLGLADAGARGVRGELTRLVESGRLRAVDDGGLLVVDSGLLVVPGAELELLVRGRPVHCLLLWPDLASCHAFSEQLAARGMVRNPTLGSQRAHGLSLAGLRRLASAHGGLLGLAHAFTPHRGFYGSLGATVLGVTGQSAEALLDFVELGLSADVSMADWLVELNRVALLASSDAHSLKTIARECTKLRVAKASFAELARALGGQAGRKVTGFWGLDPRLGKYYRTRCRGCGWLAVDVEPPAVICSECGQGGELVTGVLDRLVALAAAPGGIGRGRPSDAVRPPYTHQVPLSFVPGVGRRIAERLIEACGSEWAVLHRAGRAELVALAGRRVADSILLARSGRLIVTPGGGGYFGRVRLPGVEHATPP